MHFGRPIMKLEYFADTDSLYVDFCNQPSGESAEISTAIVNDYHADGRIVGLDIDNASHKVDLRRVVRSKLPGGARLIQTERTSLPPRAVAVVAGQDLP
jgi:uncharacterized protein YuzE